jgi:hypothetical protein
MRFQAASSRHSSIVAMLNVNEKGVESLGTLSLKNKKSVRRTSSSAAGTASLTMSLVLLS